MTASSAAYLIDWKLGGIWLGINATGYSDSDKLMILADSLDGLKRSITHPQGPRRQRPSESVDHISERAERGLQRHPRRP